MGERSLVMMSVLALIGIVSGAAAQDSLRDSSGAASARTARPTLTGKERLGPKWTDEQRIDDCHVPSDKRGTKQRPTVCPNDPSS